jgi:hypothetical protein
MYLNTKNLWNNDHIHILTHTFDSDTEKICLLQIAETQTHLVLMSLGRHSRVLRSTVVIDRVPYNSEMTWVQVIYLLQCYTSIIPSEHNNKIRNTGRIRT